MDSTTARESGDVVRFDICLCRNCSQNEIGSEALDDQLRLQIRRERGGSLLPTPESLDVRSLKGSGREWYRAHCVSFDVDPVHLAFIFSLRRGNRFGLPEAVDGFIPLSKEASPA